MPARLTPWCPTVLCGLFIAMNLAQAAPAATGTQPASKRLSTAELLVQSQPSDWRALDPSNTLVMQLDRGQVIIELAPRFAPKHVTNIRLLAQDGYFDGLAVLRVQDNFVAQWGDPDAESAERAKPLGRAAKHLPAEYDVPLKGLPLSALPDRDGWARLTGFVDGMPVAAEPKRGRAWLTHCYGMVGAGRDNAPDSSTGAELYTVIGHAPRPGACAAECVARVEPARGRRLGVTRRPDSRPGQRHNDACGPLQAQPFGPGPCVAPLVVVGSLWGPIPRLADA